MQLYYFGRFFTLFLLPCFAWSSDVSWHSQGETHLQQEIVGLIGGTSWESTALYYQLMNQKIREQLGGLNSAKILLYSVNYAPIVQMENEGKWEEIGIELAHGAQILQNAGAKKILLCCNTLHKVAPQIEEAISIPFLHIADAAGEKLIQKNIKKVGLLGTKVTMEDGFYTKRLHELFDIETITLDLDDRLCIDTIIYQELCQGKILNSSKNKLINMVYALKKAGAEAILLACTELGMILSPNDADIPLYDTMYLHVESATCKSLEPPTTNQI